MEFHSTPIERAAQEWHDARPDGMEHEWSECWCCCGACEQTNPHYEQAHAATRQTLMPAEVVVDILGAIPDEGEHP